MDPRARRARLIQDAIADVLLRNWDPIGIKDVPQAQDEYDSYVADVYRLLESGATAKDIARHLVQVETDSLGFQDTEPKMLIPVAKKLLKIRARFRIGQAAT
jgi:hypothetical protein